MTKVTAAGAQALEAAKERVVEAAGGAARLQIILVLAAVLGVDAADKGTLSAVSGELKKAFHIGNTEIGLLLAVVSFIGAIGTLPIGVLADRVRRQRVLLVAVALWAVAQVISGTATSYVYLLLARVALGIVTAAAWPCVASLTGDFFPARERAGIYGFIIAGELVGVGIGFFISGEVSSFLDWRWSFYVMAVPAIVLVWVVWRFLPEPKRGGQSWLRVGEDDPDAATRPAPDDATQDGGSVGKMSTALRQVRRSEIRPRQELVLHENPTSRSWWWAMRYLLRLPTYRLLILASSLAYYFFAGARSFAMIYLTGHYGLSRSTVSALVFVIGVGTIIGVVAGGKLSEWLLKRGNLTARIVVPAVALGASVPFLGVGLWTSSAWLGTALITLGAGILAAAVAPIDAARLNIVHPGLWGRSESGRMALRSTLEGGAPLLFGAMSGWLGGGNGGLELTFLIMLAPMLVASGLVFPVRRTYPCDIATAAASVEATSKKD